jgi:hypothetical protein
MTRLSCHRFHSNEMRLWLSVMAYKTGEPVAAAGHCDTCSTPLSLLGAGASCRAVSKVLRTITVFACVFRRK